MFELYRLFEDEGVKGAILIGINTVINQKSRIILHVMRELICRHNSLCGTTIIAQKRYA